MGIVYMLVDYGIFHLLLHSRSISEGNSLSLNVRREPITDTWL